MPELRILELLLELLEPFDSAHFDFPPAQIVYKVFVGLALDVHARWGERVGMYIVTRRRERPFEVPCEVAILFDDDAIFNDDAPRVEVIDAEGSARELAPDAAAVMAYLVASSARDG